jgi:signal transduction histidine kinase
VSHGLPERAIARLLLARLRLASLIGVTGTVPAGLVWAFRVTDRRAERLVALGLATLLSLGARWLAGRRGAARHARGVAAGYVVAQSGLLLLALGAAGGADTVATLLAWLSLGTMLVFPWGPTTQALVSGWPLAAYVAGAWPHPFSLPAANLAATFALSVAGAWTQERLVRAAVAAPARTLARQRRRLAGKDGAPPTRLRTEFVSAMSHKLRTPLNVIMGYSHILSELVPPGDETSRALDAVQRASHELIDLVEATLELGHLAEGAERASRQSVPIRDLFDELARDFAVVPHPASVVLVWEPGRAPVLSTDRRKLKAVLKNLIGNALKFTPAGSVRVECRVVTDACELRVIDTGIGIRREEQAAVFELFRQTGSPDSPRLRAGHGLYLVRQLVQVLGGRVSVESAPGHGSIFTVTLPLHGRGDGRQRSAA